jgi:hypothetical protein
VTVLDPDGTVLAEQEMIPGSSHLEPVNWRGDGREFALYNDSNYRAHVSLPGWGTFPSQSRH